MKFRRKPPSSRARAEPVDDEVDRATTARTTAEDDGRGTDGPYDVSDDRLEDESSRVDLGSLLIAPSAGRELRLQVDEASQAVQSVLVAGPDGALELRAFAAARNGDMWGEVRPQIVADIAARRHRRGARGPLRARAGVPAPGPDARRAAGGPAVADRRRQRPALAAARHVPRRAGRASPRTPATWEDVLAQVAVRRGDHAMPVGEPLPVVLPDEARAGRPAARRPASTPD